MSELLDAAISATKDVLQCDSFENIANFFQVCTDAAGAAGAAFGVGGVTTLIRAILETIRTIQVNRVRCLELAKRIEAMEPCIAMLGELSPEELVRPARSYLECMVKAGELVQRCREHDAMWWLKRMIYAEKDEEDFSVLNATLQHCISDLQLALSVRQNAANQQVIRGLSRLREELRSDAAMESSRYEDLAALVCLVSGLSEKADRNHQQVMERLEALSICVKKEARKGLSVSSSPRSSDIMFKALWKVALSGKSLSDDAIVEIEETKRLLMMDDKAEDRTIDVVVREVTRGMDEEGRMRCVRDVERYRHRRKSEYSMERMFPDFLEIPFTELRMDQSSCLGQGSFGVVYKARWRGTDYACKKIITHALSAEERAEETRSFRRELDIIRSLRHPNIVLFVGACTKTMPFCIVTEWMAGGNLQSHLKRLMGPVARPDAVNILLGVARAMQFMHDRGLIHRDLKSANILLDKAADVAKITDFGLSRIRSTSMSNNTNSSVGAGTPAWKAPELYGKKAKGSLGPEVDVYAFGIIMWELFTARVPFEGMDPFDIGYAVRDGDRPDLPLPSLAADPDPWLDLMTKCWAQEPSSRPPFSNIVTALETMQQEVGETTPLQRVSGPAHYGPPTVEERPRDFPLEHVLKADDDGLKESPQPAIVSLNSQPDAKSLKADTVPLKADAVPLKAEAVALKSSVSLSMTSSIGPTLSLSDRNRSESLSPLQNHVSIASSEGPGLLLMDVALTSAPSASEVSLTPLKDDIESIVSRMCSDSSSFESVRSSCSALADLATSDSSISSSCNVFDGLFLALRRHPDAAPDALKVMATWLKVQQQQKVPSRPEDMKFIAELVHLESAVECLAKLCSLKENAVASAKADAPLKLASLLLKQQQSKISARHTEFACEALFQMLSHVPSITKVKEVLEGLMAALRSYPTSVPVQRMSIKTLWSYVNDNGSAKKAALKAGCVPLIGQAMESLSGSYELEEDCVGCLASLASEASLRKAIVEGGAITPLFCAMKAYNFSQYSKLQEHGVKAIERCSKDYRKILVELGCIGLVRQASIHAEKKRAALSALGTK